MFYRKSRERILRVDGGKTVGKWKWRMDDDVKRSRTW